MCSTRNTYLFFGLKSYGPFNRHHIIGTEWLFAGEIRISGANNVKERRHFEPLVCPSWLEAIVHHCSSSLLVQRPNPKKNMVCGSGTQCRSWLQPHLMSNPESNPTPLPRATLCRRRVYPTVRDLDLASVGSSSSNSVVPIPIFLPTGLFVADLFHDF